MADWKTLCSELLEAAEDMTVLNDGSDARFDAVAERVRAELARPVLSDEGELTDGELNAMWNCSGIADEYGNHTGNIFEFARAAIAFDRSRRVPVPVSERLPGPEDCDAEGRCWWLKERANPDHDLLMPTWHLQRQGSAGTRFFRFTHWLPAHALPLPTPWSAIEDSSATQLSRNP